MTLTAESKIQLGAAFVSPLFIGFFNVLAIVYFRENIMLMLVSIVLLPSLVAFILTRRILDALLLVWINEMFFGGSGDWIAVGSVGGRWFLFGLILVIYALFRILKFFQAGNDKILPTDWIHVLVFFFGLVFPLWLVLYSVVFKGTPLLHTLKDVRFLFVLLIFFPLCSLVERRRGVLFSYLIGACCGLSMLLLFVSVGPVSFREPVWRALSGQQDVAIGVTKFGINRTGLLSISMLNIIVFFGVWLAINKNIRKSIRFAGGILVGIGLLPMLLTFQRGPLLGFLLIALLAIPGMLLSSCYRKLAKHLVFLLFFVVMIGSLTMIRFVPDGFKQNFTLARGVSGWVGDIRQQQVQRTWEALLEEPWFGKGVGVAIPDLNDRYADPNYLPMEAQYNMLLYRFGIIAFIIFMLPLAWLFYCLFCVFKRYGMNLQSSEGAIMLSLLFSSLAILLAGASNPYLTTPFTGFMIAAFLAFRQIVSRSDFPAEGAREIKALFQPWISR